MCADGSEPTLIGDENGDGSGVKVTGPLQCEDIFSKNAAAATATAAAADVEGEVSDAASTAGPDGLRAVPTSTEAALRVGSFDERCNLCMDLVGEVSRLWTVAVRESSDPPGDATQLCSAARRMMEERMLPTIRTCRYHPPACAAVLDATIERACGETWRLLQSNAEQGSASQIRAVLEQQRQTCGALMTQRNGSSVEEALVCPYPRDVGARIMNIAAVLALFLFAAQYFVFREGSTMAGSLPDKKSEPEHERTRPPPAASKADSKKRK